MLYFRLRLKVACMFTPLLSCSLFCFYTILENQDSFLLIRCDLRFGAIINAISFTFNIIVLHITDAYKYWGMQMYNGILVFNILSLHINTIYLDLYSKHIYITYSNFSTLKCVYTNLFFLEYIANKVCT